MARGRAAGGPALAQGLHAAAAGWALGVGLHWCSAAWCESTGAAGSTLLELPQVHAFLWLLFAPETALLPLEPFIQAEPARLHFGAQAEIGRLCHTTRPSSLTEQGLQ